MAFSDVKIAFSQFYHLRYKGVGGSGGLRPLGMGREDQGRAGSVFLQLGVQVCLFVLTTVRTVRSPSFPLGNLSFACAHVKYQSKSLDGILFTTRDLNGPFLTSR